MKKKIYVIGVGLIGGSFAIDMRKLFPKSTIIGIDHSEIHLQKALDLKLIDETSELSKINKAFAMSIILKNKNCFCFFDNGLVYKRAKYNLFGYEKKFFEVDKKPDVFEWRGLKIASLICFELRFTQYWEKFKGIDLILAPSRWGKERIEHFKTLNKALALSSQSQVLAVNSANEKPYGCSFDAWGKGVEFKNEKIITFIDLEKNQKIRKKLDIGIK
jgi:omega-amidase